MEIKAFPIVEGTFTNWRSELSRRWTYRDVYNDANYRDNWVSIDCLQWSAQRSELYLGLTRMNNDIFYSAKVSGADCVFTSLNFQSVADQFDAKFHRALEQDRDGTLWAATASLHDLNDQKAAAGGKIVHFDPETGAYTLHGRPIPGQYIQNIKLDPDRRLIYGFTYPAEHFFVYNIDSGETKILAYVGNTRMMSQPHHFAIDRKGTVWGTWGESRSFEDFAGDVPIKLFSYHPDSDEITYFDHGIPAVGPADAGAVDQMILLDDGRILIGSNAGSMSILDPSDASVQYLCKPFPGPRLAAFTVLRDGRVAVAGNAGFDANDDGTSRFGLMDLSTGAVEDLGPIRDQDRKTTAAKIHQLVEAEDGVIYLGENDNITRPSMLWRITL